MDTEKDDKIAFGKLRTVCDVKQGMAQLEHVQQRLLAELSVSDAERRALVDYRRELELLLQEKMAHVEELRQIHADINTIEEVIKQSDGSRQRSAQTARQLHAEYRPLKQQVDQLRHQLALQPLADITELQTDLPITELLERANEPDPCGSADPPMPLRPAASLDESSVLSMARVSSLLALHQSTPQQAPVPCSTASSAAFLSGSPFGHQVAGVMRAKLSAGSADNTVGGQLTAPSQPPHLANTARHSPTAFRQQPPPMKSCLSCHQQIHRNAPICPLCKAKSRSRNPKKPKKKE